MDKGWIKLPRSIQESRLWSNPPLLRLWLWCQFKARHQHEPAWLQVRTGKGLTEVQIMHSQFLYGRTTAGAELGIPPSTVQSLIRKLAKLKLIGVDSRTHYSIITVSQLIETQDAAKEACQPHVNQRSTNEQPHVNQKQKEERERKKKKEKTDKEWEAQKEKKAQQETFPHLIASEKMIEFLSAAPGQKEMLLNAAKFKGSDADMEHEVRKFFAHYSEETYFVDNAIKQPTKATGRLQNWLSRAKFFKPKTNIQKNGKGNRITGEFRDAIKDLREQW